MWVLLASVLLGPLPRAFCHQPCSPHSPCLFLHQHQHCRDLAPSRITSQRHQLSTTGAITQLPPPEQGGGRNATSPQMSPHPEHPISPALCPSSRVPSASSPPLTHAILLLGGQPGRHGHRDTGGHRGCAVGTGALQGHCWFLLSHSLCHVYPQLVKPPLPPSAPSAGVPPHHPVPATAWWGWTPRPPTPPTQGVTGKMVLVTGVGHVVAPLGEPPRAGAGSMECSGHSTHSPRQDCWDKVSATVAGSGLFHPSVHQAQLCQRWLRALFGSCSTRRARGATAQHHFLPPAGCTRLSGSPQGWG